MACRADLPDAGAVAHSGVPCVSTPFTDRYKPAVPLETRFFQIFYYHRKLTHKPAFIDIYKPEWHRETFLFFSRGTSAPYTEATLPRRLRCLDDYVASTTTSPRRLRRLDERPALGEKALVALVDRLFGQSQKGSDLFVFELHDIAEVEKIPLLRR